MDLQGKLTSEDIFKTIEDRRILRMLKEISEDEVYEDNVKYLIMEGILSTWGNE